MKTVETLLSVHQVCIMLKVKQTSNIIQQANAVNKTNL